MYGGGGGTGYQSSTKSTMNSLFSIQRPIQKPEGAYHQHEELIPGFERHYDKKYEWLTFARRTVVGKSLKDYPYCKGCFAPRTGALQETKLLVGRLRPNRTCDPYQHYCGYCIDYHNTRNATFFDRTAQLSVKFVTGHAITGALIINGIKNLSSCDGCLRPILIDYSNTAKENMELFTECMVICTCCQKRCCYDCVIGTKRLEFDIKPPTDCAVKNRRPLWVWHGFQPQYKNCVKSFNPAPYGANSLCLKCFEQVFCKKEKDKAKSDTINALFPPPSTTPSELVKETSPSVVDWEGLMHYVLNTSAMGFLGQKVVLLIGVFGFKKSMVVMQQ